MQALGRANVTNIVIALQGNDRVNLGLSLLVSGVTWSILAGSFLYPAYQAIVMRWWLGGLRLGGTAVASDLRMRRCYFAYLRYLLYVVLFTIAFFIIGALVYMTHYGQIDFASIANPSGGFVILGIVAYVTYILGVSTIYQVVVKMRLWQVAVESVLISGIAALDHVQAGEATSSAVGEGLADALGTGAI